MGFAEIREDMGEICRSKNWRNLVDFIEDGYKGIFVILRILSESVGEVCAGDLARLTGVSTARVASALNALEKKGYVMRLTQKTDARKVIIKITEQGECALEERKKKVEALIAPMLANLTEEEIITLSYLLKKLLQ